MQQHETEVFRGRRELVENATRLWYKGLGGAQVKTVDRPHVSQEVVDQINRVEARHKGKIVAIEPESGEYFVGKTTMEAFRKARKRFPDQPFVFRRIGYRWTHRQVGCVESVLDRRRR